MISERQSNIPEEFDEDIDEEEDEVDLSSLIEGGVDDDDLIEDEFVEAGDGVEEEERPLVPIFKSNKNMVLPEMDLGGPRRPPRPQLTIVDDLDDDEDEDAFGEDQELVRNCFYSKIH